MTPDLMEAGARAREAYEARMAARSGQTESGGRMAAFGRPLRHGRPDFAHGVALYMEDVSVSFDGFRALDALSLSVDLGELRCIIGPNGAGKTTMMDCITGKTRPDAGRIFFGSNIDLLRLSETQIAQVGVGRKFQKPTVYEALSVHDNLELALRSDRGVLASMRWRLTAAQRDRIGEVLALIHLAETLYLDLQPLGLGVSLVNPGFVETPLTAQNDFTMPALQTPEQAAQAIVDGLATGDFEIHFPKRFTCVLKFLQLLPRRLYFPLVRRATGL